ncbi:MAG: cytochrome c [Saprospiraceae bacterium]|nr:cytochrome c [Saprospiraceae bacterium]
MKKQIQSLLILLLAIIVIHACQGKKAEPASAEAAPAAPAAPEVSHAEGKKIFDTYCFLCHGADGKLGLNGSKDLTISIITTEERINQITNGKGLMTPFKEILTEAEIKAVASYTESLKK